MSDNGDIDLLQLSKFMSLVLRHRPEAATVELDAQGWVDLDEFASAMQKHFAGATRGHIEHIVETDEKRRYVIRDGRIRANQGHSVDVDVDLRSCRPPDTLFHGTTAASWRKMQQSGGIERMQRRHVHLSPDVATATTVAARRKNKDHVVLVIDAAKMVRDGGVFYRSENDVWLTERVPLDYVSVKGDRNVQDQVGAHRHSSNHRDEVERSNLCGCFYCLATFPPSEIEEWVDAGRTAMCPKCGIDSVLGDASGYPIEAQFLAKMAEHWFSVA